MQPSPTADETSPSGPMCRVLMRPSLATGIHSGNSSLRCHSSRCTMNPVELRQLAYFEAVARSGGFTRAAAELHVAQSAVSAQVRALEAELGVPLFARTTRRVTLTH